MIDHELLRYPKNLFQLLVFAKVVLDLQIKFTWCSFLLETSNLYQGPSEFCSLLRTLIPQPCFFSGLVYFCLCLIRQILITGTKILQVNTLQSSHEPSGPLLTAGPISSTIHQHLLTIVCINHLCRTVFLYTKHKDYHYNE